MINTKEIATKLIIDNLINHRIIYGLDAMSIDATDYHLQHLSNVVLELMDVKLNDMEFDSIEKMYDDVMYIDIADQPQELKTLATSIYNAILIHKK